MIPLFKPRRAWLRFLWLEPPDGATIGEQKRTAMINGTTLFVSGCGPLFLLLNLLQGNTGLALINAATTVVGVVSFLLLRRRHSVLAGALVLCGSGALFTLSSVLYRNGMEYTLLVCMFSAVFMFEASAWRLPIAGVLALGFLAVKVHEFNTHIPTDFPASRHAINLTIFLCSFYVLQELLRNAYRRYHRQIERTNAELAESRRQLHEEHQRLLARTEELRAANHAKEKLFSIIAHDLRGPLAGLNSSLDLLNAGHIDAKDFREIVADLTLNVGHAHECLERLLTWSATQLRGIKPEPSLVLASRAADDCVGLLAGSAARKAITLHNGIPRDARVWVDGDQLLAVLRNLVANALKFTDAGGSVHLSAAREKGDWRITVSDTGVGMTPEKVRGLFSADLASPAFGTANERGLGLGLTICRDFVESNGGAISAESTPGVGSRFSVTLPAEAPAGAT